MALEAIGSLFAQVYWYENVRSISLKSEIDAIIWRLKKMSFLWMTIEGIGGILKEIFGEVERAIFDEIQYYSVSKCALYEFFKKINKFLLIYTMYLPLN